MRFDHQHGSAPQLGASALLGHTYRLCSSTCVACRIAVKRTQARVGPAPSHCTAVHTDALTRECNALLGRTERACRFETAPNLCIPKAHAWLHHAKMPYISLLLSQRFSAGLSCLSDNRDRSAGHWGPPATCMLTHLPRSVAASRNLVVCYQNLPLKVFSAFDQPSSLAAPRLCCAASVPGRGAPAGPVAAAGRMAFTSNAAQAAIGFDIPRVLSVQSHTVTGYVGNRCAVFTLQVACGADPQISRCLTNLQCTL